MSNSVEKLQNALGRFLFEIDEYLNSNKIKYFVAFGTLLGTIRHQDFIPWDDDVDIWMLREDYDIFINEFKLILPDYYEVEYCRGDNDFPYSFAKIYDTRTTLVEYINDKSFTRGIYLDIFPIDGIADSSQIQKKHLMRLKLINRYLLAKEGFYKNPVKKMVIYFMVILFYGTLSKKKMVLISQKLYTKFGSSHEKVIVSNHFPKANYILSKSDFLYTERLPFNNFYVNVPKNYKEILTNIYGDFMKIPKDNEKISHGKRIIKYDKTYKKEN